MAEPLLSVIMPAYNAGPYLRKAIDSVLNQSYANFELLVADDCSTDETKSIIDACEDPRIKRFHNSQNQGYLQTTNLLLAHAGGEYITFQDADDWSAPDRFSSLLEEFKKDPALQCAGSAVSRVDAAGSVFSQVTFKSSYEEIRADLPNFFNCVGSALMITRRVLDTVGGYHAYFDRVGSEDLYWYGQIVNRYKTINVARPLYFYRATPGSVSGEKNKSLKKMASKDLAVHALKYYFETGKEIFADRRGLAQLEFFLLGKHACWSGQYKKGLRLLLRSALAAPFSNFEKYGMIKTYFPKLLSAAR
jgi:glycosyltransferase involved in cell wall biosynthesis